MTSSFEAWVLQPALSGLRLDTITTNGGLMAAFGWRTDASKGYGSSSMIVDGQTKDGRRSSECAVNIFPDSPCSPNTCSVRHGRWQHMCTYFAVINSSSEECQRTKEC